MCQLGDPDVCNKLYFTLFEVWWTSGGKCNKTQWGGGGAVVWYFPIIIPTQFKLY